MATVSFGHATLLCLLPSFLPCSPPPLSQDSRHKAQSLYLNPHLSYHRVSTGAGAASTPGGAGAKCPQVPAPPLPPRVSGAVALLEEVRLSTGPDVVTFNACISACEKAQRACCFVRVEQ